ncbi:MAG: peptidoglycan DD-metalloendopeptidase family protein, partial [Bradyrhizobiaceae bacterium]|nr:peptidoglycan DD-metalloendopeptidase family protein [Bradyrhizobiaceae bacterium]
RGALAGATDRAGTRKTDKLPPVGESNAVRQIIRVSTTSRAGDHQVVHVRPFVHVSGNLALSTSELSANVPAFSSQRLLADSSGAPIGDATPDAAPDAEVAFVTRDLAPVLARAKIPTLVPIEDVITRVRDAANWNGGSPPVRYEVAGTETDVKLGYAADPQLDPYAGFEARIIPENITMLPKTASQTTGGNPWNERTIVVKRGDSLALMLHDLGATLDETRAVAAALGRKGRDGAIKEGQKLRVLLSPTGGRMQPVRVTVMGDSGIEACAALSDMGQYVAVDPQSAGETQIAEEEPADDGSGVRLYQSIYETALRNLVPRQVIDNLVRIYSYDVDFQRKTQPGDSFDVVYAGEDEAISSPDKAEVLYASLTVGGDVKKFYRYQTLDDGVVDYYDETGKSVKKFLVRKPVNQAIMRSGFGERAHPILGITKMHTGVDWAAPIGTPIFASGNGVIEKIGPEGGYGKYIRIQHANGYETAYGHMSAFARNLTVGSHVRQGQIIGFVGSTGLSTGAHVHYEILVNGRFVDPMRYKLPHGRALDGQILADFERERDRLNAMLTQSPTHVAQSAGGSGR